MRALYHHRTRGRDVEAVHIRGVASGLERLGYAVEIVGPPGVHVDADVAAAVKTHEGETSRMGKTWAWVARHMPQLGFELLELAYNGVAIPRLLARCRKPKPDLIYERYAISTFAGVLAGRLTGVPTVLEVNETIGVDRTRQGKTPVMPWLAAWLERQILRQATGLVVVSHYLKEQMVAAGHPAERVLVLPNAVDPDRFDPVRADGAEIRARYGLEGKPVIGFVGSFTKWHGIDMLLRACAAVAAEFPELRVLLVGDGAQRDESEALAKELGIGDRVVFPGRVPHAAIPDYMGAMDIGVMPNSNVYGSPMKVFEYMAMGMPAVAPRFGPLEEAINDGETGLIFEPGSLESLTACLRALVAEPERRARLGRAARVKVLNQHLWEHNARAITELADRFRPAPRTTAPARAPEADVV